MNIDRTRVEDLNVTSLLYDLISQKFRTGIRLRKEIEREATET